MLCLFSACFQATEVWAGIPDVRACCLLLVQIQMMGKLLVFSTMARKCVCVFVWQGEFFELLVLSFSSELKDEDAKKLRLLGSLGKNPIWSRSQRSLRMRFCSSHARKVDVDYWLLSALLVGCKVNNISIISSISYILFLKLFRSKH